MNRRVFSSLLAVILILSLGFAGCSGAQKTNDATGISAETTTAPQSTTAAETKAPEQVTIKFNFYQAEVSQDDIAEFEQANPNIKIEIVEAADSKLMAMIASGNAPDIIRILGAKEIPSTVVRGLALNLDPYFEKSELFKKDDLLPVADLYRFDGTKQGLGPIYGFPKDWGEDNTLFYNKKLFDAAGIPVPSTDKPLTYTELFDLAKKLTKMDGDKVVQFGFADSMGDALTQDNLLIQLAQMGKSLWDESFSTSAFSSPEAKSIMQYWLDFAKSKATPSPINQAPGWSVSLFLEDKVALLNGGYWISGIIRSDEKLKARIADFGMLPAPVMEGGKRMSPTVNATGGVIYSKTEHPDEVWKFFEYFFAGKPADTRAKSGWGLPGFKSKMSLLPNETEFDKQTLDLCTKELEFANDKILFNPYLSPNSVKSIIDKVFTPVYFDKDTIDGAVEKMDKELATLIQEGKDIAGVK